MDETLSERRDDFKRLCEGENYTGTQIQSKEPQHLCLTTPLKKDEKQLYERLLSIATYSEIKSLLDPTVTISDMAVKFISTHISFIIQSLATMATLCLWPHKHVTKIFLCVKKFQILAHIIKILETLLV